MATGCVSFWIKCDTSGDSPTSHPVSGTYCGFKAALVGFAWIRQQKKCLLQHSVCVWTHTLELWKINTVHFKLFIPSPVQSSLFCFTSRSFKEGASQESSSSFPTDSVPHAAGSMLHTRPRGRCSHSELTPFISRTLGCFNSDTPAMNVLSLCLTTSVEQGQPHFCNKTLLRSF